MKTRTMFIDKITGQIWRVILRHTSEDYPAPCILLRADDWRKNPLPCFITARAAAEDPLNHVGTYLHTTEAEAKEWLGIKEAA